MLKLINIRKENDIINALLLIECDSKLAFNIKYIIKENEIDVLESDVPDNYKIYQRQSLLAFDDYDLDNLPESITSAWY